MGARGRLSPPAGRGAEPRMPFLPFLPFLPLNKKRAPWGAPLWGVAGYSALFSTAQPHHGQ